MEFIKRMLVVVICILALVYLSEDEQPAGTNVQIPPKPSASSGIYVQDYAGVLSAPARSYLQNLGRQLEQKTTAQLVVVTVKSLNGAPLEDYSLKLLRDWGIGQKEKNNGVLLLVSTGDRKSRVEVGYGLEGALTDSLTGQIQDQYMIPYFRKGTYEPGIAYGYEALALRIAKEYNVQLAVSGYANHSPSNIKAGSEGQSTEELFNKALAEQNGTADPGKNSSGEVAGPGNTAPEPVAEPGGPDQGNARENTGTTSGGVSAGKAAVATGILGFILLKAEALVDSVGWITILVIFILLDVVFLKGFFTGLFFRILLFFFSGGGGGSGGGGYSGGGGFGGGSGGGGGSSRSW